MNDDAVEEPRSWGQRWSDVLESRGPSAVRRIQRGQALARRGTVDDLRVVPGRIAATVSEDRVTPCEVEVAWSVASDDHWRAAIDALAGELRFTAALLDADLPPDLGERLEEAGIAVVPSFDELAMRCSCDEPASLCRHVAAVFTAFGSLIDRDPSLLLLLRGRDRDRLLRDIRSVDESSTRAAETGPRPDRDLEVAAGDLEAIRLHPEPVEDPAGLFLHLGDPPGVNDPASFVAVIERAAAGAWRLAAGEGAAAAEEELLLAELRGQRVASLDSLAEALGREAEQVRDELDRLFETGAVMRTGSGARARYRASS